ncbi:hypothetical protein ADUPG1_012354 [Aduncisulcus paluster]|uniref:WW domain-containing protein n=1 Tax=Aduncisulcus paluster TaxID=2918883 RepID=A0ABQ5K2H6_9EUKA|nr:hypothetical protein ADUPG1_012354 [Aduncisulcus paluster]
MFFITHESIVSTPLTGVVYDMHCHSLSASYIHTVVTPFNVYGLQQAHEGKNIRELCWNFNNSEWWFSLDDHKEWIHPGLLLSPYSQEQIHGNGEDKSSGGMRNPVSPTPMLSVTLAMNARKSRKLTLPAPHLPPLSSLSSSLPPSLEYTLTLAVDDVLLKKFQSWRGEVTHWNVYALDDHKEWIHPGLLLSPYSQEQIHGNGEDKSSGGMRNPVSPTPMLSVTLAMNARKSRKLTLPAPHLPPLSSLSSSLPPSLEYTLTLAVDDVLLKKFQSWRGEVTHWNVYASRRMTSLCKELAVSANERGSWRCSCCYEKWMPCSHFAGTSMMQTKSSSSVSPSLFSGSSGVRSHTMYDPYSYLFSSLQPPASSSSLSTMISKRLSPLLSSFNIHAFSMSLPFTDINALAQTLKETNIHTIRGEEIEFALGIHVQVLFEGVMWVWIMPAVLNPK